MQLSPDLDLGETGPRFGGHAATRYKGSLGRRLKIDALHTVRSVRTRYGIACSVVAKVYARRRPGDHDGILPSRIRLSSILSHS